MFEDQLLHEYLAESSVRDRVPFEVPQSTTELQGLLKQYGVWSDKWSDQKVHELFDEVTNCEKHLVEYYDQEDIDKLNPHLGAEMDIVSIDVLTKTAEGRLRLSETWQASVYFYEKDGNDIEKVINKVARNKERALSEKMKVSEKTEQAAIRALAEELQVEHHAHYDLKYLETLNEERISKGFPGLRTFTRVNVFEAWINEHGFEDAYVEIEDLPVADGAAKALKVTQFGWKEETSRAA